jgi:hypothetical protein
MLEQNKNIRQSRFKRDAGSESKRSGLSTTSVRERRSQRAEEDVKRREPGDRPSAMYIED